MKTFHKSDCTVLVALLSEWVQMCVIDCVCCSSNRSSSNSSETFLVHGQLLHLSIKVLALGWQTLCADSGCGTAGTIYKSFTYDNGWLGSMWAIHPEQWTLCHWWLSSNAIIVLTNFTLPFLVAELVGPIPRMKRSSGYDSTVQCYELDHLNNEKEYSLDCYYLHYLAHQLLGLWARPSCLRSKRLTLHPRRPRLYETEAFNFCSRWDWDVTSQKCSQMRPRKSQTVFVFT